MNLHNKPLINNIMQSTLTFEDVKKFVDSLPEPAPKSVSDFVPTSALNGSFRLVKQGCKLFYPKDFKEGEYKIIEIPEEDISGLIGYVPCKVEIL